MFFFDPLYLVFALPALLLGLWAQWRVQSAFKRYAEVSASGNLTGAQIARRILDYGGLREVRVEQVEGFMSDHHDPGGKVLRLSPEVYQGRSLAAAGVTAHEVGHALQDQRRYWPLRWRSAMVPSVQIGSWLGPILFIVGLFTTPMLGPSLAWLGLLLFAGTALFALVTLPVEFDASRRAQELLVSHGIITSFETGGVSSVLNAAALTYVAAAAQAISTLLYYAFLLTGLQQQED
jgi:Zn-dependent membrane protease YugP